MSTDIKEFFFEKTRPVRTILVEREPWFVASDVAKILNYTQAAFMTRMLDPDEKGLHLVQTLGGPQKMSVISEPGLYFAIMRSNSQKARAFQRWVTHEVLPSIRKTGSFAPPLEDRSKGDILRALAKQALASAEIADQRDALAAQVAEMAPHVAAHKAYLEAPSGYTVKEAATILRTEGIFWGDQNTLHSFLRDEMGWTYYQGRQTIVAKASAVSQGYVAVREYREKTYAPRILICPKGMDRLREILPPLMQKRSARFAVHTRRMTLKELAQ